MRAVEFIKEEKHSEHKSNAMVTAFHYPSMPGNDTYQSYRFGVAMANHQAKNSPTNQDAVIAAYTPEDEDIIKAAEKATGHKGQPLTNRGSVESNGTNNVSPVAKPKRNKYGV